MYRLIFTVVTASYSLFLYCVGFIYNKGSYPITPFLLYDRASDVMRVYPTISRGIAVSMAYALEYVA